MCDACDIIKMWNSEIRCEEWRSSAISNDENEEIVNALEDESAEISDSIVRSSRRQRSVEIIVKGGVNKKNNEGVTRFFLWIEMVLVLVQMGR